MENTDQDLKKTVLVNEHEKLGAKFTGFGGWKMPVLYSAVIDEHLNVRKNAGLFDVSHMGEIFVEGPKAFDYLQYITTNDLRQLTPGKAQYSLLLNEKGGVVDDIIIYMFANDKFLICVNAGNAEKDWQWLNKHNSFGAKLSNHSSDYGQIALQGPAAREILSKFLEVPLTEVSKENFKYFTFKTHKYAGIELIVACTGYTGEDGFELFCPTKVTAEVWQNLLSIGQPFGIKPIGLGARDTLRLEVCYPLHGHELSDDLNAQYSAVNWVIKYDKGDFFGKEALIKEKESGLKYKLVALEVLEPGIIREGCRVISNEADVGWVSSGTKLPTVNKAVGLAFVPPALSKLGTEFLVDIRGRKVKTKVIEKPFLKPNI